MMTAARNLKDACGRPPGSRDALYPPFPPTPDSGGEASRAPQYPVPPSRHSRHQPSLATWNLPGLGREGKEAAEREGESLVNMQWGDSATPRSRPLPNDPSLPSHPVSCNSPETLALTTRARGGSGTGRSRGADCLGRWEAVSSCWTSLEAV